MDSDKLYLAKINVDFKEQNKEEVIDLFKHRFGEYGFFAKVFADNLEFETRVSEFDEIHVSDNFIKELKKLTNFILVGFYELMDFEGFVWDKKDKS